MDIIEEPFGPVDQIWGIELIQTELQPGDPQQLFIPTTNGVFFSVLTPEGSFMYCMEQYYDNTNVTNAVHIGGDELLLSLQTDTENKLVILNIETKEERVVIEPQNGTYILDICKIPSLTTDEHPFFIMHTGKGIQLVSSATQKAYDLAYNNQTNFNVCRSIQVIPLNGDDPEEGFWLVQIDNGGMVQTVKAYIFNENFMAGIKQLND